MKRLLRMILREVIAEYAPLLRQEVAHVLEEIRAEIRALEARITRLTDGEQVSLPLKGPQRKQ